MYGSVEVSLERCVGISERDGASQRARPRAHGMSIVAALYDPLAVLLTHDLANVVTPNDDRADRRAARIGSVSRPGSRQIELRAGIAADLGSHEPPAPRSWPTGMCVVSMMMVTAAGFSRGSAGQEHGDSRKKFTHYKVLVVVGRPSMLWEGRSDDLRLGCEATASVRRRKTEAGHGPRGRLRNGLWPKYGRYSRSGGHDIAEDFRRRACGGWESDHDRRAVGQGRRRRRRRLFQLSARYSDCNSPSSLSRCSSFADTLRPSGHDWLRHAKPARAKRGCPWPAIT